VDPAIADRLQVAGRRIRRGPRRIDHAGRRRRCAQAKGISNAEVGSQRQPCRSLDNVKNRTFVTGTPAD